MDSLEAPSIVLQRIINICDVIIDGKHSQNHSIDVLSELRHNIAILSSAIREAETENAKLRTMCGIKDEALQNLHQDIRIEREVRYVKVLELVYDNLCRLRHVAWQVFSRLSNTCRRKCPN